MDGRIVSLTISLALAVAPVALMAQGGPPQGPPKNLQVLPKDTPRPQLIAMMRGVAGALGVRCNYCHVATEANGPWEEQDLSTSSRITIGGLTSGKTYWVRACANGAAGSSEWSSPVKATAN